MAGRNLAANDWNYTNDPANSQVDRVRGLCGDTDPSIKLLTDSEIEYHISQARDDIEAAWLCAEQIKAWLSLQAAESQGGWSKQAGQMFQNYEKLCETLLSRAPMAIPRAPQLRHTDRDRMLQDETLKQPAFSGGMLSEDAEAIKPSTAQRAPDEVFD